MAIQELKPLNTIVEVARYFGVSRDTVYRLTRTGELKTVTVGSRQRIKKEEVERYLSESEGGGDGRSKVD